MKYIIIISLLIIVIVSVFLIVYKKCSNNLNILIYKLDKSEIELSNYLKQKYTLCIRIINIIENKLKLENKLFNDIKNTNPDKNSNFVNDSILSECYNQILDIIGDYPKIKNIKSIIDMSVELEDIEVHLMALRTYYNKYVKEYNTLLQKHSYNFVKKIKKLSLKRFYEGKEIYIEKDDFLDK